MKTSTEHHLHNKVNCSGIKHDWLFVKLRSLVWELVASVSVSDRNTRFDFVLMKRVWGGRLLLLTEWKRPMQSRFMFTVVGTLCFQNAIDADLSVLLISTRVVIWIRMRTMMIVSDKLPLCEIGRMTIHSSQSSCPCGIGVGVTRRFVNDLRSVHCRRIFETGVKSVIWAIIQTLRKENKPWKTITSFASVDCQMMMWKVIFLCVKHGVDLIRCWTRSIVHPIVVDGPQVDSPDNAVWSVAREFTYSLKRVWV